jgi:polyamine oxidase
MLARFALRAIEAGLVIGALPERVSLAGAAAYRGGSGGNLIPAGGYQSLASRLAAGLDIRLDTAATEIVHGERGAMVRTPDGDLDADRVVVTIPLGVLKEGSVRFDPPLVAGVTDSIGKLAMATLEKVVIRFGERFWAQRGERFVRVGEDCAFPYWCDLSRYAGSATLAALYNPAFTPQISEMSSEGRAGAALEALATMFGSVPEPSETLATDWRGDRWARGAYSFIPLGAAPEDMARLGRPISQRLLLAGEATVPSCYGTVQAAFVSGLTAAARVLGSQPELLSLGAVPASWLGAD